MKLSEKQQRRLRETITAVRHKLDRQQITKEAQKILKDPAFQAEMKRLDSVEGKKTGTRD